MRQDAADAAAAGVEGDEGVIAAKENVAEAVEAVALAQQDAARTVTEVAEANADAQRRISEALEDQTEALQTATDAASTYQQEYDRLMANLSPNARKFVEDARSMGDAWKDLRITVQDRLFAGLGDDLKVLGETRLPLVKTGLADVATGINRGLRRTLGYLSSDLAGIDLELLFSNSAVAAENAGRALEPLTRSLVGLASTGSSFLPDIMSGLADGLERFDRRIAVMRATGELAMLIDDGIERVKQIGRIVADSVGIVREVFRATSADGDSMLDGLERRLDSFRAKLASDSGQDEIREFFDAARDAWAELHPILQDIAHVIGESLLPAISNVGTPIMTLVEVLASMAGVLADLGPLLEWLFTGLIALKAVNVVSGIVGSIGAGFMSLGAYIGNAATRLNAFGATGTASALSRVQRGTDAIGASIANWATGLAATALLLGQIISDVQSARREFEQSTEVYESYQRSEPQFREELTDALNDSDGVADESVRAAISNRFRERIESLRTIPNQRITGWMLDPDVSQDDAADAAARRDAAVAATAAWDELGITYGEVANAIVGTNQQYDALIARVQSTSTESEVLLQNLQYLRGEYIQSRDGASRMASAYEDVRINSMGAADAVGRLTEAFAAQRRDQRIQEDAQIAAEAALDGIQQLLANPLTDDAGNTIGLDALVKATGELEYADQVGRDLDTQLMQLADAFAQVGAAAYTAARNAGQSEADAQRARMDAMDQLRDRLVTLLDGQIPAEKINALLDHFKLIPEALADPAKVDLDTSPAVQKVDELQAKLDGLSESMPGTFGPNANPNNVQLTPNDRELLNTEVPAPAGGAPSVPYTPQMRARNITRRAELLRTLDGLSGYDRSRALRELATLNRALGQPADYLGWIEPTAPGMPQPPPTQDGPAPAAPQPQPGPAPAGQPPAQTPPPPPAPELPSFAETGDGFGAFGDKVEKTYLDKVAPALDGSIIKIRDLTTAVAKLATDSEPHWVTVGLAASNLHAMFTDHIEKGVLPAFQTLRPGIGLDVADITLEILPRLVRALEDLRTKTQSAVGAVAFEASGLKRAVAEPVNWVIREVINIGLRNAWTELGKVIPSMPEWSINVKEIEGYSTGGIMSGYTPGRDDRVIAVGGGEAIMRPEWVRAVGPDYVNRANAAAREGGIAGVRRLQEQLAHYADGGIVATDDPIEPVQRSLWDAVRTAFPKAILTSAKRFYDVGSGYDFHMAGKAIDLAGPMADIARWIYTRYPQSTELIHWPLRGWQNLDNGRPHDFGPSTNADHTSHVHWANLGPILSDGRMVSMAEGSGTYLTGLAQQITDLLVNPMTELRDRMPDWGNSLLGAHLPRGLADAVIDAVTRAVRSTSAAQAFIGAYTGSDAVERWRPLVEKILAEKGQDLAEVDRVLMQMETESGGDPNAINLWDDNAEAGIPSKGLMQVVDPTFAAFKDPGYDNIWDPESNLRAAINYALRDPKYGSLAAAFNGHGYDSGGWLPHGGIGWNLSGKPEPVLTSEQWHKIGELVKLLARGANLRRPDIDPLTPQTVFSALSDVAPGVVSALRGALEGMRTQAPAATDGDDRVQTEPGAPTYTDPLKPEDQFGGDPTQPTKTPEELAQIYGLRARGIGEDFLRAQWDGLRSDLGLRDSGFLTKLAENHNELREGANQVGRVIEQHIHYHVADLDEAMRRESLRQRQQAAGFIRR
ncbi:transglycosylase SLT domain-containing protein [Nocardia cyriacigeorgica]|nr:transglycosylase SLT domain-containing protein [Nocardia cyriacigeorgica]